MRSVWPAPSKHHLMDSEVDGKLGAEGGGEDAAGANHDRLAATARDHFHPRTPAYDTLHLSRSRMAGRDARPTKNATQYAVMDAPSGPLSLS